MWELEAAIAAFELDLRGDGQCISEAEVSAPCKEMQI